MPVLSRRVTAAALSLAAGALAAGALVACAAGEDASTGLVASGRGTLAIQLTDAPFPFDSVKSVDVFVVRVDAKITESDSADAASNTGDDDKRQGGWTTVAEPKAKFDLLALRDGKTAPLGQASLPAGTYKSVRLIIDPAQSSITLKSGAVLGAGSEPGIKFPSAGQSGLKVQLDRDVRVGADSTSRLVIDFDVGESFVMRGNAMRSGLLFKPVLRASAR